MSHRTFEENESYILMSGSPGKQILLALSGPHRSIPEGLGSSCSTTMFLIP